MRTAALRKADLPGHMKGYAMFRLIRKWFFICYHNKILRYVFYGGLTTLVNLVVYFLLRKLLHVPIVPANIVSVTAAILFAYYVNSRFVFETKAVGFSEHLSEFVRFVGARLSTMALEVGGVWFMAEVIHMNDYFAKVLIQFIILVLNYVFSKFLVFTKK